MPDSSSGGNSLSIWTHHIRDIKTVKGDKRALAHGAPAAVKISAGMRMGELYTEMAKQKLTVMGGADPNVGVGGWTTGGGHGPLTSVHGLGADNVLEMEVVTPDGEYRVVNEKAFPNLFWAIRGVSWICYFTQRHADYLGWWVDVRSPPVCHSQSIPDDKHPVVRVRLQYDRRFRKFLVSRSILSPANPSNQ